MRRFVFLKMTVVFLAVAAPCSVLAQTQPAPKLAPPAPKPVPSAPRPVAVLPSAAVPDAGLLPKTPRPQAQTDLLDGVRSHVSALRAAPLPSGPKSLHESSAQRTADQVKVLHNWQGDPASAGWAFNVGKSK